MSTLVDFIYYKLQLSLKRRRGFMYEGCIYTKSWSPEKKYYFIWSLFPSTIIVNSQSLMTMLLVSHLKKYLSDQSWKSILIIASCCACLPTLWYLFFFFFFDNQCYVTLKIRIRDHLAFGSTVHTSLLQQNCF